MFLVGSPQLLMTSNLIAAVYAGGSGSRILSFNYTVQVLEACDIVECKFCLSMMVALCVSPTLCRLGIHFSNKEQHIMFL